MNPIPEKDALRGVKSVSYKRFIWKKLWITYPSVAANTPIVFANVQYDRTNEKNVMKQNIASLRFNMVSMRCNANIPNNEVDSNHLITEIPEDEQFDIRGIDEQGPDWKLKRKFTSLFYLHSGMITETAEFFYVEVAVGRSSASKKPLWMSKKKRDPAKEAERSRQERLENHSCLYEEREKMKRSSELESRHLSAVGRAWNVNDNRRVIMSVSIPEASGGG
ncbi:hypothetical protein BTUL_0204g00180 [Botrytis tulipae]|uniref:Uncharacterized protein n=1 Tax=Botrytis tulipae TaxID=87230 RepID=A0A4Z1EBF3_9HELO|nr:hypothetical protein BTUL_0204g00180 [Botrytis tulipae]